MSDLVVQWLAGLGARCRWPQAQTPEAQMATFLDYAEGLAHFPSEVFCSATREGASRMTEFFPAFKPLHDFLERWWADTLAARSLPGAGRLPRHAQLVLDVWDRRRAAGFPDAPMKELANHRPTGDRDVFRHRMAIHLDVMRQHNRQVFDYVCETDAEACDVARLHGWYGTTSDPWSTISAPEVRRKLKAVHSIPEGGLRNAALLMLRSAIKREAPKHLPIVDGKEPPERIEEEHQHPSHPVAEQVAAVAAAPAPQVDPGMPEETRDQKLARLHAMRGNPEQWGRTVGQRIRALCVDLGVPRLSTDPLAEPGDRLPHPDTPLPKDQGPPMFEGQALEVCGPPAPPPKPKGPRHVSAWHTGDAGEGAKPVAKPAPVKVRFPWQKDTDNG